MAKADIVSCAPPSPNSLCDIQADIFIGTAKLFALNGTLLSTVQVITADSRFGPDVAGQIAADATVPGFVRNNIFSLVGNTNLGFLLNPAAFSFDAAAQQAYGQLTAIPPPFAITGDTGLFPVGNASGFFYSSGPFGPSPSASKNFYTGAVFVNIYERDLQESLTAAPEPALSGPLAALLLCLIATTRGRTSRRVA